ncbi:MAG TPA: RNA 2'-phosphotransferase [Caulobacter sp.]|nr:RNA 2'-phosphotransferase [Caulobacter sp.]
MKKDKKTISKTLSYWLRHAPEAGNLVLDPAGWAPVDHLLQSLNDVSFDELAAVVEENDKQRFEFSPDLERIRARQGHSIEIALDLPPTPPPARLFHGTVGKALDAIFAEGLKKMARHHVHLSPDLETARRVGARRGAPVILVVEADRMAADGHVFMVSSNGVWLTDAVPAAYLALAEASAA